MQKLFFILTLSLFLVFSLQADNEWEKDLSKGLPYLEKESGEETAYPAGIPKHVGENYFEMVNLLKTPDFIPTIVR